MEEVWLVPVYSALHDAGRVQEVVEGVLALVSGMPGYVVRLRRPREDAGPWEDGGGQTLYLVVTGGTERELLAVAERRPGPVILLAHPGQNSLPSALEAVARLRAERRYAHLVYLGQDRSAALEELERSLREAAVYRWMHSARLGLVGGPSEWLVASSPDPALVTRVWGPRVVPLEMAELLGRLGQVDLREAGAVRDDFLTGAKRTAQASTEAAGGPETAAEGRGTAAGGPETAAGGRETAAGGSETAAEGRGTAAGERGVSPEDVDRAAAVYVALRGLVDEYGLDALTVRCFDLLQSAGTTGCLALSRLNDEGVVAGCEGDLPATLTMMLLSRLSGRPAFMGNLARADPGREMVWLSHCTVARTLVTSYELRSHFESGMGVAVEGELRRGTVTIARVGGSRLDDLLVETGTLVGTGHEEDLCRTQAVLRCPTVLSALLRWPLGNHHVLGYGDLAREMRTLCYIAGLSSVAAGI